MSGMEFIKISWGWACLFPAIYFRVRIVTMSTGIIAIFNSCTKRVDLVLTFDKIKERAYLENGFWAIPSEDWRLEGGKLQCIGDVPDSRVNLLTYILSSKTGKFKVSTKVSLKDKGDKPGSAGILIGIQHYKGSDIRSICYFGKGIKAGISLRGFAFLKDKRVELPEGFDFDKVTIDVTGNNSNLKMKVTDKNGRGPAEIICDVDGIKGLLAIANNLKLGENESPGNSSFSFETLELSGSKVVVRPENTMGILWVLKDKDSKLTDSSPVKMLKV